MSKSTRTRLVDGTIRWRDGEGRLHRDGDRPAVARGVDGSQLWYKHGRLHREGGLPAVEWVDGEKEWWLNGVRLTEQEFRAQVAKEQVNE